MQSRNQKKGIVVVIEFTPAGIEIIRREKLNHPDAVDPRNFSSDLPLSVEIRENPIINAYIYRTK